MNLYHDLLNDLQKFEDDLKKDAARYQVGISQEFSILERITGHLFNVCPYNFPAPAPDAVIDLRSLFNPIRAQGERRFLFSFFWMCF